MAAARPQHIEQLGILPEPQRRRGGGAEFRGAGRMRHAVDHDGLDRKIAHGRRVNHRIKVFAAKQQSGERVSLHFHANWCPTCRAQDKVFKTFQGDASVPGTLLLVDYDTERELKREMNVRSQATLIVFNGKMQINRSGGVTDPQQLRAALTSN